MRCHFPFGAGLAFALLFAVGVSCGAQQSACTFAVSPTAAVVSAENVSNSLTITPSNPSCAWTIVSPQSYLIPSQSTGTGTQTITYSYQGDPSIFDPMATGVIQTFLAIGDIDTYDIGEIVLGGNATIVPVTLAGAMGPSLRITTPVLPSAVDGQVYTPFQIGIAGGAPPYTLQNGYSGCPTGDPEFLYICSNGMVVSNGPFTISNIDGPGPFIDYFNSFTVTDSTGKYVSIDLPYFALPAGSVVTPAAPTAQLIDPVDSGFVISYSGGSTINTFTDQLASGGSVVLGAAADGVSQVLIRIPATQVGEQFNLTILDETGNQGAVATNGGVLALGDTPSHAMATLPTATTAVSTPAGPMAFAVYVAPIDFTRSMSDDTEITRLLSLTISGQGLTPSSTPITLVRPPVILVHGLWADRGSWSTFTDLTQDPLNRFYIGIIDYSDHASGVTAVTPSYNFPPNSVVIATIKKNALGFATVAPDVEKRIRSEIHAFKSLINVAAVQADIVGHSMGGDVSRWLPQLTDFKRSDTYGNGFVHKLITIGTPHLGSPLAIELLKSTNACSRGFLATFSNPSFSTVTLPLANGTLGEVTGAVEDLQGTGDGTNMSDALVTLQGSALPFPVAYLGASSIPMNNWVGLDSEYSASAGIKFKCGSADTVASRLTPSNWGDLFAGSPSDSVVTVNSQFYGRQPNSQNLFTGVIHSMGLENLNFSGPDELDQAGAIGPAVVSLLNESSLGTDFH